MNERDDGGSAFPAFMKDGWVEGMSLRDYFAAKAMQAMLHAMFDDQASRRKSSAQFVEAFGDLATAAYGMADAMLQARKG